MWVGGVVEYMLDSWYWWCYHTEVSVVWRCSGVKCQTLGTSGVTILRISVGWCSGEHIRLLVLVI